MPSRQEYKRVRPALGTFVSLTVHAADSERDLVWTAMNETFATVAQEQERYSLLIATSELSIFNAAPVGLSREYSSSFVNLLSTSLEISRVSQGAFHPFVQSREPNSFAIKDHEIIKLSDVKVDLNGIAKGAVVDQSATVLCESLKRLKINDGWSAVINAGGDLRFINESKPQFTVRVDGADETHLARAIEIPPEYLALYLNPAVATSSVGLSLRDQRSTTRYSLKLRSELTLESAVTVIAPDAQTADALTKVALFGTRELIQTCADNFQSITLVFTDAAELAESYWPR